MFNSFNKNFMRQIHEAQERHRIAVNTYEQTTERYLLADVDRKVCNDALEDELKTYARLAELHYKYFIGAVCDD
ncbi:hypothetical protein DI392_06405 [Vibrio albus]|uniref:Uncharacterized protein n=1 Tax=Vibrio albus TaxID=2200953 RepID=A0A2U3BAL1_9VIBR|nr:hypothetical protein [Vibrio albus]PWI33831.1 hypothetical protein DI392_06405 [Vibrio albus]